MYPLQGPSTTGRLQMSPAERKERHGYIYSHHDDDGNGGVGSGIVGFSGRDNGAVSLLLVVIVEVVLVLV